MQPGNTFYEMDRPSFNTASGKYCCNLVLGAVIWFAAMRFNTASGKYCCNFHRLYVQTIALFTFSFNTASGKYCCNSWLNGFYAEYPGFNTASGKYCCNALIWRRWMQRRARFNTASGKYCCNGRKLEPGSRGIRGFQYRKR